MTSAIRSYAARILPGEAHVLGEGVVWDAAAGIVRWVDIERARVYEGDLIDDGIRPRLVFEGATTVGAVAPAAGGGVLIAARRELLHVDDRGRVLQTIEIVPSHVESRLNDGTTDPAGRFLVGTLALDDRTGCERLVRVERDGAVRILDDDLSLSNGLAFSPDGRLLYSIDTLPGTVWVRDYDPDGEEIGSRHLAFTIAGLPDGMVADLEGMLWIAMWGAGEVRRYTPDGRLLEVVTVPTPLTTCPAFVGSSLDTLLITTASVPQAGRVAGQHAGRLAVADVDAVGRPMTPWMPTAS